MARTRPADRFEQLRDAGLEVIASRGLRRARMGDIARAMGVSHGTLYTYVESKEALFHWLLEHGETGAPVEAPEHLPIPTPPPGATLAFLEERLPQAFSLPELETALARRRVVDVRAELAGIVRALYTGVGRRRRLQLAVERSALEIPELRKLYFGAPRRGFFEKLTRYVRRRAERGHFLSVYDPRVVARFIAETVVVFAADRLPDPDPELLPDEVAVREDIVALIVASLIAPDRGNDRGQSAKGGPPR